LSRASDGRKAEEEDDAEDRRDSNRKIDIEAPWSFVSAIKVLMRGDSETKVYLTIAK
jgi:hypothetical protein